MRIDCLSLRERDRRSRRAEYGVELTRSRDPPRLTPPIRYTIHYTRTLFHPFHTLCPDGPISIDASPLHLPSHHLDRIDPPASLPPSPTTSLRRLVRSLDRRLSGWRPTLAIWGFAAAGAVSLFMSDVPLYQKDVLRKIPFVSAHRSRAASRVCTLAGLGREDGAGLMGIEEY